MLFVMRRNPIKWTERETGEMERGLSTATSGDDATITVVHSRLDKCFYLKRSAPLPCLRNLGDTRTDGRTEFIASDVLHGNTTTTRHHYCPHCFPSNPIVFAAFPYILYTAYFI